MSYKVVLTKSSKQTIFLIKTIREITNCDLKEAKEIIDNPPKIIKNHISMEEAEMIKSKIEFYEAQAEIMDSSEELPVELTTSEEKKNYILILESTGNNYRAIIDEVAGTHVTNSLDIRDFLDCVPGPLLYNLTYSKAKEWEERLKKLGAKVSIKE